MSYTYTKTWIDPGFDKSRPIMADTETIDNTHTGDAFGGHTRLFQIAQDEKCYIYDTFYVPIQELKHYLHDSHLVFHNSLYDLSCIDFQGWLPKKLDDTLPMARHYLPNLDSHSLKSVLQYFELDKGEEGKSDWKMPLTKKQLDYAADDVLLLEKVYYKINSASKAFTYKLDMNAIKYSLRFQLNGLPVIEANRKKQVKSSLKMLAEAERALPTDLNVNSFKQVRAFLGTEDSSQEFLTELAKKGNDKAQAIMDLRKAKKQLNFLEKFEAIRVYGYFNMAGAATGRATCRGLKGANPHSLNLQQLPRDMKDVFGYAEKDPRWLVDADFTSLEVFCVIGVMGEEVMADFIRGGEDIHYKTASMLYNKPVGEITSKERKITKGVVFGSLYGAGAKTVQAFINMMTGQSLTLQEATELRAKFLNTYPSIKKYHKMIGDRFNSSEGEKGYLIVKSPFGRPMKAKTYSEAINMPCQSAGADCNKLAIQLLHKKIPHVRLVNTVHDSITLECMSQEEAEDQGKILAECMNEAWEILLPYLNIKDLYMNNQYDVIKNLSQGR